MPSKSARRIKPVPSDAPVETASTAGPLEELFPRASRQGTLLDHWAEGRFLVEHGAPKRLEDAIATRFPNPPRIALVGVSAGGFATLFAAPMVDRKSVV
mgnify:CR=1 FL=1